MQLESVGRLSRTDPGLKHKIGFRQWVNSKPDARRTWKKHLYVSTSSLGLLQLPEELSRLYLWRMRYIEQSVALAKAILDQPMPADFETYESTADQPELPSQA